VRFHAPARVDVPPEVFSNPAFATLHRHRDLLSSQAWPTIGQLNARLRGTVHAGTGRGLHVVAQSPELLADCLHYETRIHAHGAIATRAENWHDLLNALAWIEFPALKSALNARQAADVAEVGAKQRTRGQQALTQFDEAGVIVLVRDPSLIAGWDAQDWVALFWRHRAAWLVADGAAAPRIEVVVFGHALLEHLLRPQDLIAAKALAVLCGMPLDADARCRQVRDAIDHVAREIADSRALVDPQAARPLPLSGIPGWHRDAIDEAFYLSAECFRPLRAGRRYPAPIVLESVQHRA